MKQSIKQNLILVIMTVMTLMLAFFIGLGITMPSVVALEQDARCGITEHVHRDDCYLNNVLICGEKAHTHGENCYLLRLEDNDINRLLSEIEADEEKSLEHVITNVVYEASYLELVSEGLLPAPTPTPTPTPTPLISLLPAGSSLDSLTATNEGVANLNRSIVDNNITPTIYLNERLITPASEGETVTPDKNLVNLIEGETSPTDLGTYAVGGNSTDNGGISTLAVTTVTPNNNNNRANVYVWVDNGWKCVANNITVTVTTSGGIFNRRYTATANTSSVLEAINNAVETEYTTSNVSNVYLRYTRSVVSDTTDDSLNNLSSATIGSSNVTFESNNDDYREPYAAKYVYFTKSDGSARKFYTVTLNYNDITGYTGTNPETKYLESTQSFAALGLNSEYLWYYANGEMVNQNHTITSPTTLYARPKNLTASFVKKGGDNSAIRPEQSGTPTNGNLPIILPEYSEDNGNRKFYWVKQGSDGNTYYAADGTVSLSITADTTFVAVPAEYIVTFNFPSGESTNQTIAYNAPVTFPDLPDGWFWVGDDNSVYSGGATFAPVRDDLKFTASQKVHATLQYKDSSYNTTIECTPGTQITLPNLTGNNVWVDELGNVYTGGTKVTLTANKTFYERARIKIVYTVNAPTTITGQADGAQIKPGPTTTHIDVTPGSPTIVGSANTTAEVYVVEGQSTTLLSITSRVLTDLASHNGSTYNYHKAAYMRGWQLGSSSTTILQPNASYTYEELSAYASSGTINLQGAWYNEAVYTANCFLDLKSVTSNGGTASAYTPSIHQTVVLHNNYDPPSNSTSIFGSANASLTAESDKTIRALVGPREGDKTGKDSVWIYSLPTDQQVFDYLKSYVGAGNQIEVDGVRVNVENLNDDIYAVRWFDMHHWDQSGWHINAILVRKVGKIHVTKTFEGREDYIIAAENVPEEKRFYIDAHNVTLDKHTRLNLVKSSDNGADGGYVEELSDPENHYYVWEISDIHANETWEITEHPPTVGSAVGFGEWVIVDSTNSQSNTTGTGMQVTVKGVTFPEDISSDEWLRADFTNVYHSAGSILIRKVDGVTGARIDGAVFELWQGGQIMTFSTKTDPDGNLYYHYDQSGTITQLKADGTEIYAADFTYDTNDIVIKEVVAPVGYNKVGEIQIGHLNGKDGPLGITNAFDSGSYATYTDGLLIIKNFADTVDVTAKKEWFNCEPGQWADSVEVQLYANDSAGLAAQLVGKDSENKPIPTVVTLNAFTNSEGNPDYTTYTWKNLPAYAAGSKVTWSLKEIRIGNEEIKEGGGFPNWLSFPGVAVEGTNPHGKTVYTITVSNTPKAGAELMLLKTDMSKTTALEGVEFRLTKPDDSSFIAKTGVTNELGQLFFSNLKYDTVYTITEITTPDGYWPNEESFTVKISSDTSMVTVTSANGLAEPGSTAFSVLVKNRSGEPLPETGGIGTHIYTAGGLLLMAAAMALLIYRRKRRKEADLLDV